MDYITIEDIKAYSGVDYTEDQETLLTSIGTALEAQMEKYCNRSFASEEFTEKFDGGVDTFLVANPPITSPTVTEDEDEIVQGQDYFNYGSYIKFVTKAWEGNQNIVITYTGGGLPVPLKNALIQWVLEVYGDQLVSGEGIDTEAVKNVSVGPVSVNYGQTALEASQGTQSSSSSGLLSGVPEVVADVLKLYRKNPL